MFVTIDITDKFKEFINSIDEHLRNIFDYYCLGIRKNDEFKLSTYTLDQYCEILKKNFNEGRDNGYNFVNYSDRGQYRREKRIVQYYDNDYTYHKRIDLYTPIYSKHAYANMDGLNIEPTTTVIRARTNKLGRLNLSLKQLWENPGMNFFIHPSVLSYDCDEIQELIEAYKKFQDAFIYFPYIEYVAFVCNSKGLYRSNKDIDVHLEKIINTKTSTKAIPLKAFFCETKESIQMKNFAFDF